MGKLYYNGRIYTMDDENRIYTAIGIENGRIAFLGTDAEAAKLEAAEKIDLEGACVLPGFIDSHLHLLNYAFVKNSYGMFETDSIAAVIREGKARIERLEKDSSSWLYGRGWNQQNFTDENRLLTKQDLDQISTERPILFIRVCGHAAAVNSRALDIIMKLPQIGDYMEQIDTDTGILTEDSIKLCYNVMGRPGVEQVKEMILSVQEDFNRCGITSVESDDFLSLPGRDGYTIMEAYQQLDKEGRLALRVREQPSFISFQDLKGFIDKGYRTGQGTDYYEIGPVKLYQDGSLGAKTALLNQPYEGEMDCGIMRLTAEELQACVDYSYEHDMQILTHAIGDKASDMVCDAYENAIQKYGKKPLRLAINHIQLVSPNLYDRMKKMDILAYIQPVFVATDKNTVEGLVGKEREALSYSWKTMLQKGLHCCGSSDSPVESFSVLEGIQIAVTRQGLDEQDACWHPSERLTAEEAVRLFTIDNAYGAWAEKKKGSLEVGKLADMVVLGEDIFQTEPHKIHQIPVLRTIVGGREVWRA
ncbi:MAG: amidohydrolase [Firmicutes bacterium]|nr:amidohydrolase [Bacillota bacterium]